MFVTFLVTIICHIRMSELYAYIFVKHYVIYVILVPLESDIQSKRQVLIHSCDTRKNLIINANSATYF